MEAEDLDLASADPPVDHRPLLQALVELSAAHDLDGVVKVIRERTRRLIGCDGVTFVLREGDVVHYRDEDAIAPLWKGRRFPAAACISGWAILHRRAVTIEDVLADERVPKEAYEPTFVRSLAMVPIRTSDPIGAIGAYWATRHRATPAELELLQALAEATALAARNAELWSERDATARTLAEREAQLRLVTDAVPALISSIDATHRYRFVNRAYETWFGLDRRQLVGRELREVLGPAAYEAVRPHLEQALRGEQVTYEAHVPYRAGGTRWIEATYTPDRDAAGRVIGVVALVHDITERKRTEQAIAASEARQRELVRARDEFLGIASHELRTPLVPLTLLLQTLAIQLERDGAALPPEKVLDKVRRAEAQVHHLHRLVDRLLDVTRLDDGGPALQLEQVDLDALVAEVVERSRPDLERAGCAFTLRGRPGLVGRWDRVRVEQVVVNLLDNALKYGRGRPVSIDLALDGATAVLSVRDEGIGIPSGDQRRLFGRFERAVSTRHYGGFGLGLWISRRIVEALAGTIDVESEVGRGSTFVVRLPLAGPAPA